MVIMKKNISGVTLIEMVIYIAFIAILLPGIVYALVEIQKYTKVTKDHIYIEQTSSLLVLELKDELLTAQSIISSSSTFGIDYSELVYVDDEGNQKTVLLQNDSWLGTETPQLISRIQTVSVTDGEEWLTTNEIDVQKFIIRPVYANSKLVGLRFEIEMSPIFYDQAKEDSSVLDLQTIFELSPYVQEL